MPWRRLVSGESAWISAVGSFQAGCDGFPAWELRVYAKGVSYAPVLTHSGMYDVRIGTATIGLGDLAAEVPRPSTL